MTPRLLLALTVASAAAQAEQGWVVEPGQAVVTVQIGRSSATSLGLSGHVRELTGGALYAEVRVPLASFTGSAARRPPHAAPQAEIVFEGAGAAPRDGIVKLRGTLTVLGVSRQVEVPAVVARAGSMAFGHLSFNLPLRDFGLPAPAGITEAHVEIDAGLKPEASLASRD